jgi:hypothetical protein
MQMPSPPNAKWRVLIAFAFLFVFMIAASIGAWRLADLGRQQEQAATREGLAALRDATDTSGIEDALRQHPQNKFLQLTVMATRTADETNAAIEKLSDEIAPAGIPASINLGKAGRSDLDALRRDLKAAEANTATLMPRYAALLKAERDAVEKYALALRAEKDTVDGFLQSIDRRHAETTALLAKMLPARAEYYRAYEKCAAILASEFGTYRVENGQFVFPFQLSANRYNAAAGAMAAAAARLDELEQERKDLLKSQHERWTQFVNGK